VRACVRACVCCTITMVELLSIMPYTPGVLLYYYNHQCSLKTLPCC